MCELHFLIFYLFYRRIRKAYIYIHTYIMKYKYKYKCNLLPAHSVYRYVTVATFEKRERTFNFLG